MSVHVDANDVAQAVELASWVATMLAMLVMGLIVYFMVRPSRRRRERRNSEIGSEEAEQMLRLMERMEQRLGTLERIVSQDSPPRIRTIDTEDCDELRRIK